MIVLAITSSTWLITCIGFCTVLILLFIFVYIMKLLGWIMQPHTCKEPIVPTQLRKEENQNSDTDEAIHAAIAFTLQQHFGSVHDMVAPRLTIKRHATAWKKI